MASRHVNRSQRPNEHMAAPTQACYVRFSLPTRSRPHMARSGGLLRRRNLVANGAKRTSAGITLSRLSRPTAKDHLSLSHGITLAASLIRSAETSSGRDRLHAIFIRSIHQRP
jgi:hypothetical protein